MGCRRDPSNVDDLDQGVGWSLEQYHRRLLAENRLNLFDVGSVHVVNDDAHVLLQVCEQTIGAAVEIVTSDDLVAGLENSGDHVARAHARADDKRSVGAHDLGQVALYVAPSRVATAGVVVLLARPALESSGLVDRHAAGVELVTALGEDQLRGQGIFAAIGGRGWGRRWRKVVAVEVEVLQGLANAIRGVAVVVVVGGGHCRKGGFLNRARDLYTRSLLREYDGRSPSERDFRMRQRIDAVRDGCRWMLCVGGWQKSTSEVSRSQS